MFLFAFLNRSITDGYYPLYEAFYVAECLFLLADLLICPTIAYALLSTTSLHLNTRLIIACAIPVAHVAGLARLGLIYYQYFGGVLLSENAVILCSLCRAQFVSYFCGILPLLAIDRLIATTHWRWYESQHPSTLLIFVITELLLVAFSIAEAVFVVYGASDFVHDFMFPFSLLAVAAVGVIVSSVPLKNVRKMKIEHGKLFIIIYFFNIGEVASIKRGAQINRYSVARAYQFRENVVITKFFFRLAVPIMIFAAPAFFFYFLKTYLARTREHEWLRLLASELFDFSLGIAILIVAPGVVLYEPRVMRSLKKIRFFSNFFGKRVYTETPKEIT